MSEWALREELAGHDEDVRAVAVGGLGIITGSRDKSVRLWCEKGGHFELEALLIGHSSFVTTVAAVPAGALKQLPGESIVSGSRDLSVIIWNKETGAPAATLTGHQYQARRCTATCPLTPGAFACSMREALQVSCVAVGKHSEVISTSHDGTVRVYSGPGFAEVQTLRGHEGAVQAVLVLPDGSFLTGGNDATIRLWRGGECVHVFRGHTDTVRGLALLPDIGVVSASHDMSLRLWDFAGSLMAELLGHTAIVYAAAGSPKGLIASASEDGTARLWTPDGACVATLPHPGCVWSVAFLPDGDLVSGCSDYSARVWTSDASRYAPEEARQALAAAIAARQQGAEAGGSGGGDSGLPAGLQLEDAGVLARPGSHEGQVKVVREDGGGMAYCWSAAEGRWEQVGQVVAGPQSGEVQSGGSHIDGVRYDHVISVEVDDRPQPLRLGVNADDNPYTLADSFIARHDLPPGYREQIVQYIVANTSISATGSGATAVNADPFTGGSAYVPGAGRGNSQPGSRQAGDGVTGGGADPFTGSAATAAPAPSGGLLPARSMITFASLANPGAVAGKLRSLAADLPPGAGLSEAEAAPGGTLDRLLSSAAAAPSSSATPGEAELALLARLLAWPAAALFPALDVARMLALQPGAAARLAASAGSLADGPPGTLGGALATAAAEPQLPANQQTALRLACNALASSPLRPWLLTQAGSLLDAFSGALAGSHRGARAAGATLLLNLAVATASGDRDAAELGPQLLSAAATLLAATPAEDEETLLRGTVALGTLLTGGFEAREVAAALECRPLLQRLRAGGSQRVAAAAAEAAALL